MSQKYSLMKSSLLIQRIFNKLLSAHTKEHIERIFLVFAIIGFLGHLALIYLVNHDFIHFSEEVEQEFFQNPIAAIYTPFSFILIYEVYLLVFYIPQSVTTYVRKQYEIITLIVIRRLSKTLQT